METWGLKNSCEQLFFRIKRRVKFFISFFLLDRKTISWKKKKAKHWQFSCLIVSERARESENAEEFPN